MRVISQGGEIDVPYEHFSFSIASEKYKDVEYTCSIYCHNLSAPHGTKMAEYTSEKKALMAMELLRKAYSDYAVATVTNVGLGNVFITGDKIACTRAEFSIKMFGKCMDFQFPHDDEVQT
mgnify:CR=1 FL=1|nr:MAG TPA: hypothetical protein [Caudoviricetes sp.]